MQPFFKSDFYRNRNFLKAQISDFLSFFLCFLFFCPSTLHPMYKATLPIPNSITFPDGFLPDSHRGEFKSLEIPRKRGFGTQRKA